MNQSTCQTINFFILGYHFSSTVIVLLLNYHILFFCFFYFGEFLSTFFLLRKIPSGSNLLFLMLKPCPPILGLKFSFLVALSCNGNWSQIWTLLTCSHSPIGFGASFPTWRFGLHPFSLTFSLVIAKCILKRNRRKDSTLLHCVL